MRLVHYSADIVTKVHGHRQSNPLDPKNRSSALPGKPKGFWLSDDDEHGWRQWCKSEGFRTYSLRYEHEVKLSPKARILYLRTAKDIDDFAAKYGFSLLDRLDKAAGRPTFSERYGRDASIDGIDWHRLTRKYHGIVITPYIWEQRLGKHMWYYTWDCASGCIWNARAIESITMVKERKVPRKPTAWEQKRKHKRDMIKMAQASKNLVVSMAKTRPPSVLDQAVIESADQLIDKYGGRK